MCFHDWSIGHPWSKRCCLKKNTVSTVFADFYLNSVIFSSNNRCDNTLTNRWENFLTVTTLPQIKESHTGLELLGELLL